MKLKPFKPTPGFRKWCGPTALSILTGRSIGYCSKLAAEFRNASYTVMPTYCRPTRAMTPRMVRGMQNYELIACLERMGFEVKSVVCGLKGKTLFRVMEEMATDKWRAAIVWNVTNHYVVTQLGVVYDSHDSDGSDYRKFWCRKRKVVQGWIVSPKKR